MAGRMEHGARGGALVVGASSGMGAALARRLAAEGYRVALVARRGDQLQALAADINGRAGAAVAGAYPGDVRDFDAAPALFARIAQDLAPLRLVVYAAGVMPRATTGADFTGERDMMAVNVLGAMRWLGLAADYLEHQGGGTLVGISSVAGDRGRPGNGAYMASKSALSSYLDSLRFRLARTGVRVVTIKAGFVTTPMTAGLKLPRGLTITADNAARRIARASERGRAVAYVPGVWAPIMWVVRHLPAAVVARMPG